MSHNDCPPKSWSLWDYFVIRVCKQSWRAPLPTGAKFMGPANYVFFYFLLLIDLFIFLEKKKKKQQKTTLLSALVTQLQPHENAGAVHDAVVLKY